MSNIRLDGVSIRAFAEKDIPDKIRWINDRENNSYLHYELPLEFKKTTKWYQNNIHKTDRYDAIIEYAGMPVGIIGLLSIKEGSAEYYVTLGEHEFKGKGIAKRATILLLSYAFFELELKKVYLYTEVNNKVAQKLFESCGFTKKDMLNNSAINRGRIVERYHYVIDREEFEMNMKNNQIVDWRGDTGYKKR